MLVPNETIRRFIDVNKGVVNVKRNKVYIFINKVLIGSVRDHSIEEVFSCIYETTLVWKVQIQEWKSNATLIITIR